ncbi:hypothetical protein FGO68_gene6334 [Halteria grandinella]|uniref:Uncharacterized protein n=1 Tax=Halteria grandinella TaxID=5974 RepID=A0A8J8P4U4_HALGN|nr:hypothetical protein FGO68_gene6334 [Halteria grandinella]
MSNKTNIADARQELQLLKHHNTSAQSKKLMPQGTLAKRDQSPGQAIERTRKSIRIVEVKYPFLIERRKSNSPIEQQNSNFKMLNEMN